MTTHAIRREISGRSSVDPYCFKTSRTVLVWREYQVSAEEQNNHILLNFSHVAHVSSRAHCYILEDYPFLSP
jgi:hypothetical protein